MALYRKLSNILINSKKRILKSRVKYFSSEADKLMKYYNDAQKVLETRPLPRSINREAVFACNELNLEHIQVYGFDFDYTIVSYKKNLESLLYDIGKNYLVEKFYYPKEIINMEYDSEFCIRGLHYDVRTGVLMKLDSFAQIQPGTCCFGRRFLKPEEIEKFYSKRIVSEATTEQRLKDPESTELLVHLADLYSLAKMNLLVDVINFLACNKFDFNPHVVYNDVSDAIHVAHPIMHKIVKDNFKHYIEKNDSTVGFFKRLIKGGKKLFIVTNSPYTYLNEGMEVIIGSHWKDYFDAIIVNAGKPKFFTNTNIPIREVNLKTKAHYFKKVETIEKGKVYLHGNVTHLHRVTGWDPNSVLYFGDHPYSDLADLKLQHGWRTCAICRELDHEIKNANTEEYRTMKRWLLTLSKIQRTNQDVQTPEGTQILQCWQEERVQLKKQMHRQMNQYFGSTFWGAINPSFFWGRISRFSDIYTSALTNLCNYELDHTFYVRRNNMPHEN